MRIVPFKPRHAPGFFVLNRRWLAREELWEAPHADELSDPAGRITARGGRIYVAERRGLVVGTCAVVPGAPSAAATVETAEVNDGMEIRWLAVDPDWQRLGIGRRLLTRCVGHARRQGAPKVAVSTCSRLSSGLRLYRKFGFVDAPPPSGTRPAVSDVYMELELKPAAEPLRVIHSITWS